MSGDRFAGATDQELMRCVQENVAEAFDALYDRLAPKALRVAGGVCADDDRARDAVQDGFLSIWRGRARYRPERGEVHTWAFEIVRNRAIDSQRRNGRHDRRRHDLDGVAGQLYAPDDPEADAVASDDARHLRALLADLPATQREVIALAYFGQLSHSEIALELGLPVGTVKSRMRLGLSNLREHLAA
jgi:RNA polymerase sigma-70 factor (ECF subfamily)